MTSIQILQMKEIEFANYWEKYIVIRTLYVKG